MYYQKCQFNNLTTFENCNNEIFDPKDKVLKPYGALFLFIAGKPTPPISPSPEFSMKTDF